MKTVHVPFGRLFNMTHENLRLNSLELSRRRDLTNLTATFAHAGMTGR